MKTMNFSEWLSACASVAMESEWCIDPSWPRWQHLYDKGLSPEAAVTELFQQVSCD